MNWLSRFLPSRNNNQLPTPTRCFRPRFWRPTLELLEDRCTPTSGLTSSAFNFNNTPIAAGSTLWFNSELQAHGLGNGPVTVQFTNQTIAFTANGTNYNLNVPNSILVFAPGTTTAATTFNATTNTWNTALPSNLGGNQFLSGVALSVPNGLPANISNVTWQGQMLSDTANIQVQWQWGAAVYTNFSSNYTTLNVKPCDDGHASVYQVGDHAGSPEAYTASLTAGGTGDGHGNNYTGNAGPNTQLTAYQPAIDAGFTALSANFNNTAIAPGSTLWFSSNFQAHGLGQGTVTLQFTSQTITFTANGTAYSVPVPDSTVVFSSTTTATATYDAGTREWLSADPSNLGGNLFFSGVELALPNGLPANVTGVTWEGLMQSDTPNIQVQWQWGAAVYTSFNSNYNLDNIKPCDDGHASAYQTGDHAGTPEAYTASLTAGGTGDGHGNNYTGNSGPNVQMTPTYMPPSGAAVNSITYIPGTSADYPFTSSNPLTSVAFNESDVLAASAVNLTNNTFDVWYTDEHAMTLGVNQMTVIAANGTSTTTNYPVTALNGAPGYAANPQVGAPTGTDPANRPLAPSLYITDITTNPNSRSGDWQNGGTALAPSTVFGTWKSYTETIDYTKGGLATLSGANDPDQNQWNLGTGADAPPAGLHTEGYTAEVRWNLSDLAKAGVLLPGHNYRFYVMVHDGDQNKSGGDVGQASYSVLSPIPAPVTASVSGYALQDNGGVTPNSGIEGAILTLTGTTNSGQAVNCTTKTDANGYYYFGNLLPGTYSISETPPNNFSLESASPGTVKGTTDGSVDSSFDLTCIKVNPGDTGINYDFLNNQALFL